MEETLKITKNHHKHLNNPFPSTPRSLPLVQGTLAFNPQTVPSDQIFSIGKEFLSTWRSKNGGSLSISHQSEPNRAIWSTIPGQAFVSAALASISAKYWVFFDQKSSNQIGFHVKIGKPNSHFHRTISSRIYGHRIGWRRYFPKRKAIVTLEFIERFTDTIGRPPELPEWIISGAVVGMQGGTDFVRDVWDKLQAYDVPISAFWLQDWVGQRKTVIGSQLWWNWEVDTTRYFGWQQLIRELSARHIKVMTYCNPCLAQVDEKPNTRRNHFEEAKELDILIKDKKGEPYMVPNTAFDVGMLDLTHPRTASWFKQILQEMVDDGVRGWMADFGEGLPVDALLYSGEDPISAHNRYPELWAKINREFVEEWKSNRVGKEREDPEEALVFFMRAGFRNSPKWGMLFWEGDQMVSWQTNDGIKSAVVGLLSSGLSGYAFNHSDIGGYCAVKLPFLKYERSEELLLRWMELNAFTTVFRTHEEASRKGLPVCRHLFLHYPHDEYVHNLRYEQFLVGEEILVVPVLEKGKKNVKVYFPSGETCSWKHVWTKKLYTKQGSEAWVEAPVGYPAIFVKAGSFIGETFLKYLREYDVL